MATGFSADRMTDTVIHFSLGFIPFISILYFKVAMYSDKTAEFQEDRLFDLVAMGVQNVWICEVGSKATDSSFEAFMDRLISSQVGLLSLKNSVQGLIHSTYLSLG